MRSSVLEGNVRCLLLEAVALEELMRRKKRILSPVSKAMRTRKSKKSVAWRNEARKWDAEIKEIAKLPPHRQVLAFNSYELEYTMVTVEVPLGTLARIALGKTITFDRDEVD